MAASETGNRFLETGDLRELLSEKRWLVEEEQFDPGTLNIYETLFTVGNGYLGTRGSLEEGHAAGLPRTFINGLFDHHQSFVVELANTPDWPELHLYVEGIKLGIHECEILDHYRALDMRSGCLFRETRFRDKEGRITRYQSLRYAHWDEKHLCELQVQLTPENYNGVIEVEAPIDANVFNLDLKPAYKEPPSFDPEIRWEKWARSMHLGYIESEPIQPKGIFLELETLDRPHHLGYASALEADTDVTEYRRRFQHKRASEVVRLEAKKGEPLRIRKAVAICTSRDQARDQIRPFCEGQLQGSLFHSFLEKFESHRKAWNRLWDACDIIIKGDPEANRAVRFNIYHLLIAANPEDERANIGAKSLSGEGYKGHVFWDTEIFMLPFFIYSRPETARALLKYRYHTIEGAREYARESGYEGIRYPWESADTGHETTPKWTADGSVRIYTGERELHITAAVTYGLLTYVDATGDIDFMLEYGAEMLFGTARFWYSRLEYNESGDRYELTGIEGPDEFHKLVDNNVYTNRLTQWNLNQAADWYQRLQDEFPEKLQALIEKMSLDEEEINSWREKAEKIYIPYDPDRDLIEQFEGYFDLKEVPITEWDENNMPVYPDGYHHDNCEDTKLLKQPDVVMLLYLLPDRFSREVKKANYEYYEKRTMHKSSLSPSIHAIMGVETGNHEKALLYFERSAYVDLKNNQDNTEKGIHIASAGGTWQAMVNGFGGMRVKKGRLTFNPWLPPSWEEIRFRIRWQGHNLSVHVEKHRAAFTWAEAADKALMIEVQGDAVELQPGRKVLADIK